ncbi:ABC transporter permease [Mesorhizobium sp. PL10]
MNHKGKNLRNISIAIITFWALIAIIGPVIAPFPPDAILSAESFSFAAEAGPLGTDYLGRDLLSRLLYATSATLGLALIACSAAFAVGVFLGFGAALSGAGRAVDNLLSRFVDAVMSFPSLILALVILGTIGSSTVAMIAIVALVEMTRVFRIARALAMDIDVLDFVQIARARGESMFWLASREILPNCRSPLLAEFGLRYTYSILMVSSLSFLGLGVQPPGADWGVMVHENIQGLVYGSPAALIPAACIASITVAVNLLVDYLMHRENSRLPSEISQ